MKKIWFLVCLYWIIEGSGISVWNDIRGIRFIERGNIKIIVICYLVP